MALDGTAAKAAVDELIYTGNATITALEEERVRLVDQVAALEGMLDDANVALGRANGQITQDGQRIGDLLVALDAANARIAELEAELGEEPDPTPDPEPEPPPPSTQDSTPGPEYSMTIAGMIDVGSLKTASNTWDQAFDAAISQAKAKKAATGVAPPIVFPAGERGTLNGTRTVYDGMCLIFPGIGSIQRSANSIQTDWRYNGTGPMFVLDHTTFDFTVVGASLQSNNGGVFLDTKGFVLWESTFRDLGFNGWKSGFGTPTSKFLHTLCTFDGRWNVNNCRGPFWNAGGSDSIWAMTRYASDIGGNATYKSEFAASNGYQLALNGNQKADINGLYFTCEGAASGVLIAMGSSDHLNTISRSTIEGRNAGAPCQRDLLRVRGGRVSIDHSRLNYAAKPVSVDHGAPVVVESGAELVVDTIEYNRATGVADTVPLFLVKSGGTLRTRRTLTQDGSQVRVFVEAGGNFISEDNTAVAA